MKKPLQIFAAPIAASLVMFVLIPAGDALWPMPEARQELDRHVPSGGAAFCVYYAGSFSRTREERREYLVFPEVFRTGRGVVVERREGRVESYPSTITIVRMVLVQFVFWMVAVVMWRRARKEVARAAGVAA